MNSRIQDYDKINIIFQKKDWKMKKENERKFKNSQRRLAKKIAKAHKTAKFQLNYEQKIPSAKQLPSGNWRVKDRTQIIFPAAKVIGNNGHRLIVIMDFETNRYNLKAVSNIVCRGYKIERTEKGFKVMISFRPNTVAMFK